MSTKEEIARVHRETVRKAKELADGESGLKQLLEGIRKLYFKYDLIGEIEITKGGSMTEAILTCDVDGTEKYVEDPEVYGVKLNVIMDAIVTNMIKLVTIGVEKMLRDLIHRSKAYWKKVYKDDMTLAGTFTWSDPKGFFTTTIGCSATIASMHNHLFKENEFELTYGFTLAGEPSPPRP
jgi:hypothetical protein